MPARLWILGPCGSGKSTLADAVAARLSVPVVHIDEISFLPGWQERPRAWVTEQLDRATQAACWVVDGNVGREEQALWHLVDRADRIVWLDLPRGLVISRVVRRILRRALTGETCCNGNRETLRTGFFARDAFVRYAWHTWPKYRERYGRELAGRPVVRLRTAAAVRDWLESLT